MKAVITQLALAGEFTQDLSAWVALRGVISVAGGGRVHCYSAGSKRLRKYQRENVASNM